MKFIKKIIICLMLITIILITLPVRAEMVKIPLINGSGYVQLADKSDYVYVDTDYNYKSSEFRGVWVSPLVDDISKYSNMQQYKSEIISVLDNMQVYNLNVLIFHIRIMNDALYESKYSNWSIYYNESPDWEALPWVIEECHKRGIEFHAWMNPYRVRNGQQDLNSLAKEFPSINPASNPDNLLQGANSVILNPGIPVVKEFLVKVCMEVVEKYDVDAIHFDDYFYDYKVDDSMTRKIYNTEGLSLGDFRRKQVDDFIHDLSNNIRSYNEKTGKRVQLGISPSGVYRSGDGKVTYNENGDAITNGSLTTTTYIHYDDYLYSDTLKWINEEWIDYILPQCYWSIEHPMCPYADLLSWWNRVCKYKKVNVYSGIGLGDYGQSSKYSWVSDTEAYYEILIANGMENVGGVAFFSYKTYKRALTNSKILKNVDSIWNVRSLTPEIQYGTKIIPDKITGLEIYSNDNNYTLRWNQGSTDKFYAIYRSEGELTFSPEELIDVTGIVTGEDGKIEYVDTTCESGKTYTYGIKAQSNSLTLGEGETISTLDANSNKKVYLGEINYYFVDGISKGNKIKFAFDNISYFKGSNISYELTYKFDNENETNVNSFTKLNNTLYTYIDVPQVAETFTATLRAYNNIGETIVNINKSVTESLPNITNFGIYTDLDKNELLFKEQYVNFVFNLSKEDNMSYILEYSQDGFNWTEYLNIDNQLRKYRITEINCRFQAYLNDNGNKQYYRIKGIKDDLITYSNVVEIEAYEYLSSLGSFLINGKKALTYYELDEFSDNSIEWNVKNINNNPTEDIVYYSINGKDWYNFKLFVKYTNNSTTSKYKYDFILPDSNYEVYIKVVSTYNDMKNESITVKIRINKTFISYDEFTNHLVNVINVNNTQTNLYK